MKQTRIPIEMRPGRPERYDYEYERNGVCNLFVCFAPLLAWRHVKVTDHRAKVDFVQCMKELSDVHFPDAETVVVVLDNLNTHRPSTLYERYPPAEAKHILDRLEFHYTPKHGGWLNMAEIEFSVLTRQCLAGRVPDPPTLKRQVSAWQAERNARTSKVNWQFTTTDARTKLKTLYPSYED